MKLSNAELASIGYAVVILLLCVVWFGVLR